MAPTGAGTRGEGSRRVRGTTLHVPVVHGSIAVWQGPRSVEHRTHRWWLYLRPVDNVDISHCIREVELVLHDCFDLPVRRLSEMPYEIDEYGWGEFDAVIRVHLHDPAEKYVELFHPVKLFAGADVEVTKKPISSEQYDEIVFQDPSERLLQIIKSTPHGPGTLLKSSVLSSNYRDFSGVESKHLTAIEDARGRVRTETELKRNRWEQLEHERAALLRDIPDEEAKAKQYCSCKYPTIVSY